MDHTGIDSRLEATRVDNDVRLMPHAAACVMAITRKPGDIRDNRITAARQAIKQR
jgi:hypothetical protein